MVRGETYFDLETLGKKQKRRSDFSVTDVVDSIQGGRRGTSSPSGERPVYRVSCVRDNMGSSDARRTKGGE